MNHLEQRTREEKLAVQPSVCILKPMAGDEFFAKQWEECYPRLLNYAHKLTGNLSEAEELVQETAVRAIRFFHRFQRGTNFKAWLFKILSRLRYDQWRDKPKFSRLPIDEEQAAGDTDTVDDPVSREMRANVRCNIGRLSVRQQQAVTLRFVVELSYANVAECMGITIGAVKATINQALKKMNRLMTTYRDAPPNQEFPAVDAALDELTEVHHSVLKPKIFEGVSNEELAAGLGWDLAKVTQVVQDGSARLVKILLGEYRP